jgi:hypothetical protein
MVERPGDSLRACQAYLVLMFAAFHPVPSMHGRIETARRGVVLACVRGVSTGMSFGVLDLGFDRQVEYLPDVF